MLGDDGVMDGRRTRRGGCNRVGDQQKCRLRRASGTTATVNAATATAAAICAAVEPTAIPMPSSRRRRCGDDRDGDSGRARHTRRRARFDPSYGMFGHSAGFGWSIRIAAFDVPGGSA